jgi:hypothetical protein
LQRLLQRISNHGTISICRFGVHCHLNVAKGSVLPFTCGAAPHAIDCEVVREANEKSTLALHAIEQPGPLRETHKDLLQQVPRVGFTSGEVQQKPKQRLRMSVVEPGEFVESGHAVQQRRRPRGDLSTLL